MNMLSGFSSPIRRFGPKNVLVVDDNPDFSLFLSELFDLWGFRGRVARHAEEALGEIAALRPDLIIIDYMMPGDSGVQLYWKLQEDPALAAIPVLFVSAYPLPVDDPNGALMDRVGFLVKPFEPSELWEALDRIPDIWHPGRRPRRVIDRLTRDLLS